jgi:hypothetical protein
MRPPSLFSLRKANGFLEAVPRMVGRTPSSTLLPVLPSELTLKNGQKKDAGLYMSRRLLLVKLSWLHCKSLCPTP